MEIRRIHSESQQASRALLAAETISQLSSRLAGIEQKLEQLLASKSESSQEFYSTADVASLLRKAEWTVREWCRLGRIHAEKRACGRGSAKEWMICHDELQRIRSEGLLPTRGYRHRVI